MRKAIAAAMSRSKREIPHYYLSETIPMRRAQEWLAAENARRPLTGRILMAAVQLKAVALALRAFPDLNGTWREGAYVPSASINTGVAISLRQGGLVAPGIRDVQDLPLDELMAKLADLVKRARAGSLRSSEFSDPTITVTNLGDTGVETTYAVIYPPQVAIVGFGRVAVRPWVEEGALVAMPAVVATVSADHRVSDGHRGAAFLADLSRRLQEPEKL
jgi:pyruvate dehydrogenase E2 component (dihydrolipoamide acetyltransferase)